MTILARVRIPIPPHLVGPVLKGISVVCMVLAILLFLCLLHTIVTQRKTVFGPGSKIKIKGAELVKELLSTILMMVACIALSIFSFLQVTSGEAENTSPQNANDPFATFPSQHRAPRVPMSRPGRH